MALTDHLEGMIKNKNSMRLINGIFYFINGLRLTIELKRGFDISNELVVCMDLIAVVNTLCSSISGKLLFCI